MFDDQSNAAVTGGTPGLPPPGDNNPTSPGMPPIPMTSPLPQSAPLFPAFGSSELPPANISGELDIAQNSGPTSQPPTVQPSYGPLPASPTASSPFPGTPPSTPGSNLADIKQKALQSLAPLVGHLDQTPEEKFKTTMMMIQASDDSSMVPTAYEAANQITDEKARAQALLDVINEINYFNQQKPALKS